MGLIYATIGVIYSAILAFVVVSSWQRSEGAGRLEGAESHAVADLIRLSPGLPEPERTEARPTLVSYPRTTIDVEWPRMAAGEPPGSDAGVLLDRLWEIYGTAAERDATLGRSLWRAWRDRRIWADCGGNGCRRDGTGFRECSGWRC